MRKPNERLGEAKSKGATECEFRRVFAHESGFYVSTIRGEQRPRDWRELFVLRG